MSPDVSDVHVPSTEWDKGGAKPPAGAQRAARRALAWRDKHGDAVRGGTQVGWTRANQLANGETLSPETIGRMASFARHRSNAKVDPRHKSEPWRDAGHVAWLLWGGDAGVDWAIRWMEQERAKKAYTPPPEPEGDPLTLSAEIIKLDEQQVAYGWASVISEGGEPVVDTQGDVISAAELMKFTTDFMTSQRTALAMHQGAPVGQVLHSMPLTKELAESFGITADREGWVVGLKVNDSAVWKRVQSGELRAFSIGGRGRRIARQ